MAGYTVRKQGEFEGIGIQEKSRCSFRCFLKTGWGDMDLSGKLKSVQSLGPLKLRLYWWLLVRTDGRKSVLILCLV